MNTGENANRLLGLFKSLDNPPFFLYRTCHYLNWFVPRGLASYIYKRNKKEYESEGVVDYLLGTYDGSGQTVHPDIAFYKGKYWLTVTPYPYGMEEYENPCIYTGDSLSKLSIPEGPIVVQHRHAQGVHLSDPCLAVDGEHFFCYYRESERKGNVEENSIWGIRYNELNKKWGEPVLIMNSLNDKLLSPAMVFMASGVCNMFYVSTLNNNYSLVSRSLMDTTTDIVVHQIIGMPDDYVLWHIGISKKKDVFPNAIDSCELLGLFLAKAKKNHRDMKLFEAHNNGEGENWHIIKEIEVPEEIKYVIAFPYKSCFIPKESGAVLFSFRDKKSRNRLIIIG